MTDHDAAPTQADYAAAAAALETETDMSFALRQALDNQREARDQLARRLFGLPDDEVETTDD